MAVTRSVRLFDSIVATAARIRAGEVSPLELVSATLQRIDAVDGQTHSYLAVARESALEQAATAGSRLAAGDDLGPLHGIPFGAKDIFDVRGLATTANSSVRSTRVAIDDATTVRRLREAGAVLVGKHALHEFAYGGATFDTPWPPARNPWDVRHVPGGSSSGSAAAVAAGLCFAALGSDTGGSVRKPAALCGVVGLKPTFGRVSRHGMVPLSRSLDHVGILTRSVEDCAVVLGAIAGPDDRDPSTIAAPVPDYRASIREGVAGLRLGVAPGWLEDQQGTDSEVAAAFRVAVDVLERAGATIVEVDHRPFVAARDINTLVIAAEAYADHEATLRTRPDAYGPALRRRLIEGSFLTAADYLHARAAQRRLSDEIDAGFEAVDAIVTPSTPRLAEPFDEVAKRSRYDVPSFTNAFNLAGLPAMSVPCGRSGSGLPIGLQIAGRRSDEATVFRVGWAYEQATPWRDLHPGI